ncbi:helix-turn-helix transcriptional regulator [Hymenobacter negativus]|uniref:Helix-turn-helix domain-containing protein n=1 Tax=Hymenobacter negativus TaxID=2795026 RepID=A0ABS3QK99_9BACT|nr:helix-turn-helix domain-containing protein [Hymenobacter negativus]MBO2011683.1 helix-turn-helix domain-containing protein [Hymenobacter negativus]
MSRPVPSNTVEAAVRAHFGLTQAELGRYLGVSERQIGNIEAGRRTTTPLADARLARLGNLLPPPTGQGTAAPVFRTELPTAAPFETLPALPDFGSLPPAPLLARQRSVAAQAARLRWALHREGKRNALQSRRQWALAVLQTALLAEPAPAVERAHITRWLDVLAADVTAAAPSPATVVERALAVVRLLALDTEAAALARLLGAG